MSDERSDSTVNKQQATRKTVRILPAVVVLQQPYTHGCTCTQMPYYSILPVASLALLHSSMVRCVSACRLSSALREMTSAVALPLLCAAVACPITALPLLAGEPGGNALVAAGGNVTVNEGPTECSEEKVKAGDELSVYYALKIAAASKAGTPGEDMDSTLAPDPTFDFTVGVGEVIEGWDAGLIGLCQGAKATLIVPPSMGYGEFGSSTVPGDATLRFDIEVVKVKPGRPINEDGCKLQTDCAMDTYCDDHGDCSPCSFLATRDDGTFETCDAMGVHCCAAEFLTQCPGDPTGCNRVACDKQEDCSVGNYCDDFYTCAACSSLETRFNGNFKTCDVLDAHCCAPSFLKQCPSNPSGCCGEAGLPDCPPEPAPEPFCTQQDDCGAGYYCDDMNYCTSCESL